MNRLFVICGHGEGDPGAVGYGEEAERVRALGSRIKALGGDAVTLYPQGKNCYRRTEMKYLEPGAPVIELHLDSSDSPSARGGHVIIKDGYSPDRYDEALAAYLAREFPGRSETIVGRTNLYNCNMAAQRGINYRLVEFCFVSNRADMAKFDAGLDDIALAVLAAFEIEGSAEMTPEQDKMLRETNAMCREILKAVKAEDTSGRTKGGMGINTRFSYFMNEFDTMHAQVEAMEDALGTALGGMEE